MTTEKQRLQEKSEGPVAHWQKWGPYVAERSWASVREDYSENGDAWTYSPFDTAHRKVFRWGEDGIAGWCDRYQVLCFVPAFWNGQDPILKERLFGVTPHEGNHGEDVKELYYYLDGTPTHSYMKYLYKYPHKKFPYEELREKNRTLAAADPEFELVDTGIFNEGRYFDITIEYAKNDHEETCIKIEAHNRGPDPAPLTILGQLIFRNQWGWKEISKPKPSITAKEKGCLEADDFEMLPVENLSFKYKLGKRYLYGPTDGISLLTENETKDSLGKGAFHDYVISNNQEPAVNDEGTKGALCYQFDAVAPGESVTLHFLLSNQRYTDPLSHVESMVALRRQEADLFYDDVHPEKATEEERKIQRQALAGILWTKQIYLFDVERWMEGDNPQVPPPLNHQKIRNEHWRHLNSMRILLMPDKWEYPWFAAWDLAFHALTLALIDPEGAKDQLWLLLFDQFQHPNGQIPSYEWEFSDLNPPVQAWAIFQLYKMQENKDREFLERCFHKLLINFAWWVNKVDSAGNNVFEGGFLGMDNISLVDRSESQGQGIKLEQSDGTGWMALFCLNMMRIAMELAKENRVYESLATKFFEHYVYIGHAMKNRGNRNYELWSDSDGFFYDVLSYPDGNYSKFRVRSLVGVIPMFATDILSAEELDQFPELKKNYLWFLENRSELTTQCVHPFEKEGKKYYLLSVMNKAQFKSVLNYLFDPKEFYSPFGLRSLSKYHEEHPFILDEKKVGYEPAESPEKIKGGNSNWRGPIWMQMNFMAIDVFRKLSMLEKELEHEGLSQEAEQCVDRLLAIFKKNEKGFRPFLGEHFPHHGDPNFEEHLLFYEYFNPETGKGLGASHQTGWTALIANLIADFKE